MALTVVSGTLYLILFPLHIAQNIRYNLVTSDGEDHEEYLWLREMEYTLKISAEWMVNRYYLLSSYRRTWLRCYHRVVSLYFKLVLVLVHTYYNEHPETKIHVLTLLYIAFLIIIIVLPPFRHYSSNVLYIILHTTIMIILGITCLKSMDPENPTLVERNMADILLCFTLIGMVLSVLWILFVICLRAKWPVNAKGLKLQLLGYKDIIEDLRSATRVVLQLKTTTSYYFVRKDILETLIDKLIFHYKYIEKDGHLLTLTLMERLEQLTYFFNQVKHTSLLPCQRLEENLDLFSMVMQRRWRQQVLMNPIKRRVLLKLYILKLFMGDR